MEEFHGLTAEMYQAIVAIVDDRLREVRITREGFDRLEGALARLTEAQTRTEERVGHLETRMDRVEAALEGLAEAQARTEARVDQLAEAQARTEARLEQLAQAQARPAAALQRTQEAVQPLARQVGGDIQDIASIVLYDVLNREFGWEVGVLERTWQQWNGDLEEITVFGRATDPAQLERTIWIVGEAKHNLTLREVERFAQQAERARPEVRARLRQLGIPLLFSYGRFA
jgi:septal ring factor EnvC (AmiA/AmiB activator)